MEKIFEKILNNENKHLTEAFTPKQKREILNYIKEHTFVPVGRDYYYFIVPVDKEHIIMDSELEKKLKKEGLYGGCLSDTIPAEGAELPIDLSWVPIYGYPHDKFNYSKFAPDYESCFAKDTRDRILKLSKYLDLDAIK